MVEEKMKDLLTVLPMVVKKMKGLPKKLLMVEKKMKDLLTEIKALKILFRRRLYRFHHRSHNYHFRLVEHRDHRIVHYPLKVKIQGLLHLHK